MTIMYALQYDEESLSVKKKRLLRYCHLLLCKYGSYTAIRAVKGTGIELPGLFSDTQLRNKMKKEKFL